MRYGNVNNDVAEAIIDVFRLLDRTNYTRIVEADGGVLARKINKFARRNVTCLEMGSQVFKELFVYILGSTITKR